MNGFEELTLELTDWCPSFCRHCSSNSGPNCTRQLGRALAVNLVEQAAALGAQKVGFGGGEPTASPDFLSVLRRTTELDMHAEVFTCGFGTSGQRLVPLDTGLLGGIRSLPNLKMIFSVHGGSSEVHDFVTQRAGSFAVLLESIAECRTLNLVCEINFVPMRVNVHEFASLVDLAEQLDIRRISVLRLVPQGRGFTNMGILELSAEEEDAFVAELMRLRDKRNIDIRTGSPFNGIVPGNAIACRAGSGKIVVQADGNVLPCEVFKHDERRQWNLSVHRQSLREILESEEIGALRAFLQHTSCLDCPIHKALRLARILEAKHEQVPKAAVHS
jgi:radical SAM protein with 4Fe4S-binding SPASM domain